MTASPASIDELRDAVTSSAPRSIRIAGAGTKRPLSARAPEPADLEGMTLDLRRLSGLIAYDPAECVVTAFAGTPVQVVADALAAHGQYLPWDPPLVANGGTVGGMVASGLSGPGRYRYGGVRDFVIGARVVDGRGRLIRSGGQVVKNAAGFLLHHALVGSAGRLGVVADVSVKVFPRPEATATIVARAATLADAVAAHDRLRLGVHDLDALDLIADPATILVRLAGAPTPLPARVDRLREVLGHGRADVAGGDDERRVWADAAATTWAGALVAKVPTVPSRLLTDLTALAPLGRCRASVGGAVIYVTVNGTMPDVDGHLRRLGLPGVVVVGPAAGALLGPPRRDLAFADRIVAALDPDRRFR